MEKKPKISEKSLQRGRRIAKSPVQIQDLFCLSDVASDLASDFQRKKINEKFAAPNSPGAPPTGIGFAAHRRDGRGTPWLHREGATDDLAALGRGPRAGKPSEAMTFVGESL